MISAANPSSVAGTAHASARRSRRLAAGERLRVIFIVVNSGSPPTLQRAFRNAQGLRVARRAARRRVRNSPGADEVRGPGHWLRRRPRPLAAVDARNTRHFVLVPPDYPGKSPAPA